ncbi:hypothetical protein PIB30_077815 [Stylosanthes scabra]|uniref:Uncharacterized protein n=1 Tax=Stylosanthes scabra TaxID=79078 RepID=A0ABU6SRW3_9FABA|nr:hypothetical protein [Stylosanthes scabra]
MSEEKSFLALVHHTGKIKKNSKVGIRFSSEEPISVFIRSSTTLAELQNTILQKLGVVGSKRISKLFYRAPVAVVFEHVKYGFFVVQTDADLEVIFHCQKDFSEVRMTELFAKLEDIIASSGGSNPNPPSVHIGCASSSAPVVPVVPVIPPSVASPYFAVDLHREDDYECDLEYNHTFGELVTAVVNNAHTHLTGVQINEPEGVEEALHDMKKKMNQTIAPTHEENDVAAGFGGGGSMADAK